MAAFSVAITNNISLICRYIIEIWPVMIAYNWENCVLLAAFTDKRQIFSLRQLVYRSACGDGSLCAPHGAPISFIYSGATQWTQETEQNLLNNRDFSFQPLIFSRVCSQRADRVFEWATAQLIVWDYPWYYVGHLCIPPDAARDSACAAAGPSKFWRRASLWVSFRTADCSY